MKKNIFLVVLTCIFYATTGFATIINGLNSTVGYADMDGMQVTVNTGSSSETLIWGTINNSTKTSGVSGTNWSLTFSGNNTYPQTYGEQWNFTSTNSLNIDSIKIWALPGNTVFDIFGNSGSNYYTAGSAFGYWTANGSSSYQNTGSYNFGTATDPQTATWTFSDPVEIAGAGQQGYTDSDGTLIPDVYTTLLIDFNTPQSNLNFNFLLDTDHVAPVPEPATFLLFGLGLLGISAVSRKRHKA